MFYRVISEFISTFYLSGGTAVVHEDVLQMRRDILKAIRYILRMNPQMKDEFRTSSGFIWAVSVLDGIGKHLPRSGGAIWIFSFFCCQFL
jgi:hypothetical protein